MIQIQKTMCPRLTLHLNMWMFRTGKGIICIVCSCNCPHCPCHISGYVFKLIILYKKQSKSHKKRNTANQHIG